MNLRWTLRPGFDPLSELQRQVDRLFDFTMERGRQLWQNGRQFPAFNLYEMPAAYLLVAPLPGVKPEDLDLSVGGDSLILKGERKRPAGVSDEGYRRQERWQGRWSRTIPAPEKADLGQVSATMQNGLLLLTLPKALENQPRPVPVRVNGHASS